jgi:[ribosomal protein S5]-alanine N-acetyltransferase
MEPYPTLHTERLVLRAFTLDDAPAVRQLAQAREVARMMLHLPHPYEEGMAEEWIASLRPAFEAGTRTAFAVTLREEGALVGTVSLFVDERDGAGLLAFWIGLSYWGKGYATEAVAEVVRYGFEDRSLRLIRANRFGNNTASGRVLSKIGMVYQGTLPDYYDKWGAKEDRVEYILHARDWHGSFAR